MMFWEHCPRAIFLGIRGYKRSWEGKDWIIYRLLYVWNMRHPASGYVQGINDVVTPFIVVFLSEYIEINLDTLDVPAKLEDVTD